MPLRAGIISVDRAEDGRTPRAVTMTKLLHYNADGKPVLAADRITPDKVFIDLGVSSQRIEIYFREANAPEASRLAADLLKRRERESQFHVEVRDAEPKQKKLVIIAPSAKALEKLMNDEAIAPYIPPDDLQQIIQPALDAQMGRVSREARVQSYMESERQRMEGRTADGEGIGGLGSYP